MRYRLFLIGLIFLFSHCTNDEIGPDEDRVGFSFFPVEVGTWRTYDVNKISYRIIGDTLIENYQLREEIVDAFLNTEGDSTYVLHRSILDTISGEYELDSVWAVRRTPNQAIIVENNTPFVKMGFPIAEGLTWDGNVLNTLDEEVYTLDELGQELVFENMVLDNTLRVVLSDVQDTIIRFDQRFDYYALNVGLVRKRNLILNYCSTIDCLGEGIVESGLELRQELTDYGPK